MTLVLSMNPFLDPEGDPPLSTYQPIWESERCTKTCLSNPAPPCSSEEQFTPGTHRLMFAQLSCLFKLAQLKLLSKTSRVKTVVWPCSTL